MSWKFAPDCARKMHVPSTSGKRSHRNHQPLVRSTRGSALLRQRKTLANLCDATRPRADGSHGGRWCDQARELKCSFFHGFAISQVKLASSASGKLSDGASLD